MSSDPTTVVRAGGRARQWAWLWGALFAFIIGAVVMAYVSPRLEGWMHRSSEPVPPESYSPPDEPGTASRTSIPPGTPADVDSLTARQAALAAQLATLEARIADTGVAAGNASANATRAEALLIAAMARRALDRGSPLGYLEEQLRVRFPNQPRSVAVIVTDSHTPTTLDDLRVGLDALSPKLIAGTLQGGWLASIRREVSGLIVLRREDTPSSQPDDRLERARRLVNGGQVEGAIAEVVRMPGADAAGRWITAANRYVEARRALDSIEAAAILGQAAPPEVAGQPAAPPAGVPATAAH